VVLIAQYILDRLAKEYDREVASFEQAAIIAIRKYPWPGNIRELENRLKKAVILADTDRLDADDLDLDDAAISDRILPLSEAKEAFQQRYIDQVLALNNGNRTKTARDLGVDPRTVFRHLERRRGAED
jgi:DNA-binding NtrC family response regulator